MSLTDQQSGTPPAVTHEMLDDWRKLADDVTAALTMGGEAGMDMLRGLMAEWCEAVEDVNAAREICVNMAADGRRHEAVQWHADGFFEVADRLSPERPGWEAWEQAFAEIGVIVPRMNHELREMADQIHEDLVAQDLSGRTLGDQVNSLRRNVLARGHHGERLTLLQEIRAIDPAARIWEEMLRPIRGRRAGDIEGEIAAAIAAEDFFAIDRLKREVDSGDWGAEGVPAKIATALDAAVNWRQSITLRRPLAEAAAEACSRAESLKQVMRNGAANAVTFPGTLEAAVHARSSYVTHRQQLQESLTAAQRIPAITQKILATGLVGTVEQSDAAVRAAAKIIDEAATYAQWVQKFRGWEADAEGVIHSAPLEGGGDAEQIKRQCRAWLDQRSAVALTRLGKIQAGSPVEKPQSTTEVAGRLEAAALAVRQRLERIKRREKLLLFGVIGAIGLLVVVVVVAVVVAAASRS